MNKIVKLFQWFGYENKQEFLATVKRDRKIQQLSPFKQPFNVGNSTVQVARFGAVRKSIINLIKV